MEKCSIQLFVTENLVSFYLIITMGPYDVQMFHELRLDETNIQQVYDEYSRLLSALQHRQNASINFAIADHLDTKVFEKYFCIDIEGDDLSFSCSSYPKPLNTVDITMSVDFREEFIKDIQHVVKRLKLITLETCVF